MNNSLFYQIALTLLPNVGAVNTKKLLKFFGHPENVFLTKKSPSFYRQIPRKIAESLKNKKALTLAEKELKFIEEQKIKTYFYTDPNYPARLKDCEDGPILLYGKGKLQPDVPKIISIVGTRKATKYGMDFCAELIDALSSHQLTVVSGMAYGIDIQAHRSAVQKGIPTIGILAHGLNRLYPSAHGNTAQQMMENGGLLTDFPTSAPFHPGNFPARNRIVAGLSDATIVIESAERGGSLITAEIANSYCREVFAVPGKVNDHYSKGCHALIKKNKAALLTSAEDLIHYLGWESNSKQKIKQETLFCELSETELSILRIIRSKGVILIDDLCSKAKLKQTLAATVLLEMELKGLVKNLPGSRYAIK